MNKITRTASVIFYFFNNILCFISPRRSKFSHPNLHNNDHNNNSNAMNDFLLFMAAG
ncbi:hypothetical protein Hanom_Chr10g00948151 [Helianthus anomalus]